MRGQAVLREFQASDWATFYSKLLFSISVFKRLTSSQGQKFTGRIESRPHVPSTATLTTLAERLHKRHHGESQRMMVEDTPLVSERGSERDEQRQWIRGEVQNPRYTNLGWTLCFVAQPFLVVSIRTATAIHSSSNNDSKIFDDMSNSLGRGISVALASSMSVFVLFCLTSKLSHGYCGRMPSPNVQWSVAYIYFLVMMVEMIVILVCISLVLDFDRRVWQAVLVTLFLTLLITTSVCARDELGLFASMNTFLSISAILNVNMGFPMFIVLWIYVLSTAWMMLWATSMLATGMLFMNGSLWLLPVLGFLVISFYFTNQVYSKIVHYTVGSAIGSWWYRRDPFHLVCSSVSEVDIVKLFGSICLGSCLLALPRVVAVKLLGRFSDTNNIDDVNEYAFIYMGQYRYSFLEAGERVNELIRARGWESIAANKTVRNFTWFLTIVTGMASAVAGVVYDWRVVPIQQQAYILVFCLSSLVCSQVCYIVLSSFVAAANAVLVFFAEAPEQLRTKNPEVYRGFDSVWAAAWPDDYRSLPSIDSGVMADQ